MKEEAQMEGRNIEKKPRRWKLQQRGGCVQATAK